MTMTFYQHILANNLRAKGVPPEWAILAAKRCSSSHCPSYQAPSWWLVTSFVFALTPEGEDFWRGVYDGWQAEENHAIVNGIA